MANLRMSEQEYSEHKARRARECADSDFVDIGIGSMRLPQGQHVDTEKAAAGDAGTGNGPAVALNRESSPAVAPQRTFLDLRGFAVDLEMPPSVNDAWHHIPATGGKALTDEHRQFRSNTISRVRAVMRREPPLLGRIELVVQLFFANRRRTDLDNRVKPLQDALTHAKAYADDCQIDRLVVERIMGPREYCRVHLREIA